MIGFGTKSDTKKESIQFAIDSGYKLIDTKDTNESLRHFKSTITPEQRNNIFLCSKLMGENSPENHRKENVKQCCNNSLLNAGIDYWDIYYIHTSHSFDGVSLLDTYDAILDLKI